MRWIWLVLFVVTTAIGVWIVRGNKTTDNVPAVDENAALPEVPVEPAPKVERKKSPNEKALEELPTGSPLGEGMGGAKGETYRPPEAVSPPNNYQNPSTYTDSNTFPPPPPSGGDYDPGPPSDFGTATEVSPPVTNEYEPFEPEPYSDPIEPPEPVDPESIPEYVEPQDFENPDDMPPPPPPPPPLPEDMSEEDF